MTSKKVVKRLAEIPANWAGEVFSSVPSTVIAKGLAAGEKGGGMLIFLRKKPSQTLRVG